MSIGWSITTLVVVLVAFFVLSVPSLMLVFSLLSKRYDLIEKFVISIGLSLALFPLSLFWFNILFDMAPTFASIGVIYASILIVLFAVMKFKKPHQLGEEIAKATKGSIWKPPKKIVLEWVLVIFIVSLLTTVRYYALITYHYIAPPGEDPAFHIQWTINVLNGHLGGLYPRGFHLMMASISILSNVNPWDVITCIYPLWFILSALAIYAFARSNFGFPEAFSSLIMFGFLSVGPWHYNLHCDGRHATVVASDFLLVLYFLSFLNALKDHDTKQAILAGVMLSAIALYHQLAFLVAILITVIVFLLTVIVHAKSEKKLKKDLKTVTYIVIVFALVGLYPFLFYSYTLIGQTTEFLIAGPSAHPSLIIVPLRDYPAYIGIIPFYFGLIGLHVRRGDARASILIATWIILLFILSKYQITPFRGLCAFARELAVPLSISAGILTGVITSYGKKKNLLMIPIFLCALPLMHKFFFHLSSLTRTPLLVPLIFIGFSPFLLTRKFSAIHAHIPKHFRRFSLSSAITCLAVITTFLLILNFNSFFWKSHMVLGESNIEAFDWLIQNTSDSDVIFSDNVFLRPYIYLTRAPNATRAFNVLLTVNIPKFRHSFICDPCSRYVLETIYNKNITFILIGSYPWRSLTALPQNNCLCDYLILKKVTLDEDTGEKVFIFQVDRNTLENDLLS